METHNLTKLFKQLDRTRLALHRNSLALDSDLKETYDEFIGELEELELLIEGER